MANTQKKIAELEKKLAALKASPANDNATFETYETAWDGRKHVSGRAETQTIKVGDEKKYLALIDGKSLPGLYARRRHARQAVSQTLRRLGIAFAPRVVAKRVFIKAA